MAKVKVLFFGKYKEDSGRASLWAEASDLEELLVLLEKDYPFLQRGSYLLARNQEITRENQALSPDDEIAVMPPFAGG